MKKTLLLFTICTATVFTLTISGCSKKDNNTGGTTMKNVAGTYQLTALTITSGGVTIDGKAQMDDCQKDDNIKLNADSTYNYIDAGTKCQPDGSYDGNWKISGNLLIVDSDTSTIKSFNGTTLVTTVSGTQSGIAYTSTQTLTKK